MFVNWWAASRSGWTSNILMNPPCRPSNAMVVVFITLLLACSSVPLDTTGMTKCMWFLVFLDRTCLCLWINRVRTKLREADPDYDYTIDICLRCFYHGFNGSSNDPVKGFLQSSLLVKVRRLWLYMMKLIPYYRPSSTFLRRLPLHTTSPFLTMMSIIRRILNLLRKLVVQKLARQRPIQERQLQLIYKWRRSLPGLLLIQLYRYVMSLTPYVFLQFLQLALALSDAPTWCIQHNGMNFREMYDTIIDFFEDVPNQLKKRQRQQLLAWWNQ